MKKKKLRIIIISLLIVCIVVGAVTGIVVFRNNSKVVDVISASYFSAGDMGSQMSSEGIVCDDAAQSIYLTGEMKVADVFVTEGQEVKTGDPLLAYDVTSLSISVEMKQLEVQSFQSQLESLDKKLKQLKNTKPVEKTKNDAPMEEPADIPEEPADEEYELISDYSSALEGDGTAENPYHFSCSGDTRLAGSFLNKIKQDNAVCVFEISDDTGGAVAVSVNINGGNLSGGYDKDDEIALFAGKTSSDYVETEMPEQEVVEETVEEGYTAEELKKAIEDQSREISEIDLSMRMAQVELTELQNQLADGTVYAKADGVITKLGDKDNPPKDGEPFLQVSGVDGYYISGLINELDLSTVEPGQPIMATNYETGETYEAKISKIDSVPSNSSNYYGECNPNSSFYGYTAYIERTDGLKKGDYLELSIDTSSTESGGSFYLDQMMVREENGKSYVYKDKNGKLVKQYVTTGKSLWGSFIEIKSGVTEEDYLAFPYGVKEGQKTKKTEEFSFY